MNEKIKKSAIICSILLVAILLTTIIVSTVNCKKDDGGFDFEAYYNEKVEKFCEDNKKYVDTKVDVAFIGDSLTEYYDLNKYYPDYVAVNRGIGGDKTFGLEDRLKVSAYDVAPKVVVMLIGTNNLYTMFDNYERIVKSIVETLPSSDLVILSLAPMGGEFGQKNNAKIVENNIEIKRIANLYGCRYIDIHNLLLDPETNEIYENYTVEGVHFTEEGYAVLTSAITPVLQEILQK